MKYNFSELCRWQGTVGRSYYVLFGVVLFVIKFNLDRIVSSIFFHTPWSIFDYQNPGELLWKTWPQATSAAHLATLLAMSLPFLWLGVGLTLQRLRSAGLPLWLVILFVVPVVKLIFFLMLCLLPSQQEQSQLASSKLPNRFLRRLIPESALGSAIMGVFLTLVLTIVAVWLGTEVLQEYGWSLFVGLPFAMGFFSVMIYTFHEPRLLKKCLLVAFYTVLVAGLGLLAVAFEGIICLIMAFPLATVMALAGGAVAYEIQSNCRTYKTPPKLCCLVILAMPAMMELEHYQPPPLPLLEVKSSIEINAAPEVVWKHVVTFAELPPPREFLFHLGIAYPIRAEIRGQGVGAIRYCQFSTGPFVEPIQVWDEPRLLQFSVTRNPAPLEEWTPYHEIHPPHLSGFLVSQRGQFELIPLANGHTRLEGTTWYYHHMWPASYWQVWSDYIIHRIHLRVLEHIKNLAENDKSILN